MRQSRGFSLLEVLISTALLAAGLLMAFAAVRSTQQVIVRADARIADSEVMSAVLDVMRHRLEQALPMSVESGEEGSAAQFDGQPTTLRFVAEVPGYIGYGGAYLHEFDVVPSAVKGAKALRLSLVMWQPEKMRTESSARPPEVIADRLKSVQFRYRGWDAQSGRPGEWANRWSWSEHMAPPQMVAVAIQPLVGPPWPEMIVAVSPMPRLASP